MTPTGHKNEIEVTNINEMVHRSNIAYGGIKTFMILKAVLSQNISVLLYVCTLVTTTGFNQEEFTGINNIALFNQANHYEADCAQC